MTRTAHELPRGEVEVVVNKRQAVIGDDLGIVEVRDIDDAPEARWTVKDLVGVDDQRRVFVLIHDHWSRGVSRPARGLPSVIRWHVIEAGNHRRLVRIFDIDNDHTGVPPRDVEPVLVEIDFVAHDVLCGAVWIELILGRVLFSNVLTLDV